jgi:hypothetical protein
MKRGELFSEFCPLCHLMSHFSEAETHVKNAKREILLAVRDMIDSELERMGGAKASGKRKARKVELG